MSGVVDAISEPASSPGDIRRHRRAHDRDALDRSIARVRALGTGGGDREVALTRLPLDGEGPIVDLVTALVDHAVARGASDLHLEPQASTTRIRVRVDGSMIEVVHLPIGLHSAVVNRLKVMAEMDIVEHRRPQDGQFTTQVDGLGVDVRVASLPTVHGEKLVLRLLDTRRAVMGLGELGMGDSELATCRQLVQSAFGLVICAGPTGAGKTTTLYASLLEVDAVGRNVTTIEDPVEYTIPGITQTNIDERVGVGFAAGLRALLRQDPDVILVGEIRDVETARIAIQAALTGHLVLTSLHATDAAAALYRLLDMGVDGFLVAAAVSGVIGQRLVRRICTQCTDVWTPDRPELAFFRSRGGDPGKNRFAAGRGCHECSDTGFRGRVGVYEVLPVGSRVHDAIVGGLPLEQMRRDVIDNGFRPMVAAGLQLVERDVTTIREIVRTFT